MGCNKQWKFFLGGGGNEKQSFAFDKHFHSQLRGGRVVYIPLAWERDEKGYQESYEWFKGMLAQHGTPPEIEMWLNLENILLAAFKGVDAVYLGGGNTFRLLDLLRKSNLDGLLINYLDQGGIVYGGSAGAIVLGKSINTVIEENEIGANASSEGFNILDGLSVRCHFVPEERNIIDKCYKSGFQGKILCLPETSGVIVESGTMTLQGEEPAFLFESTAEPKRIEIGEQIIG